MAVGGEPRNEPKLNARLKQAAESFRIKSLGNGRNRWPDGLNRPAYPIDDHVAKIFELLAKNQLIVVQAQTGAGKTTRIPQAMALALPDQKVLISQTRRAAVRWISKHVADEMGSPLGEAVGYRLSREDPRTSNNTRVEFQIDQSIVGQIRRSGRLPKGVLIIDEAHERSISLDLLMGLVKEYLPQSPDTKVIVTSATIDTKKFSNFFNNAPILDVPGRMFPVEVPEVIRLEPYEHHTQGAARATKKSWSNLHATNSQFHLSNKGEPVHWPKKDRS